MLVRCLPIVHGDAKITFRLFKDNEKIPDAEKGTIHLPSFNLQMQDGNPTPIEDLVIKCYSPIYIGKGCHAFFTHDGIYSFTDSDAENTESVGFEFKHLNHKQKQMTCRRLVEGHTIDKFVRSVVREYTAHDCYEIDYSDNQSPLVKFAVKYSKTANKFALVRVFDTEEEYIQYIIDCHPSFNIIKGWEVENYPKKILMLPAFFGTHFEDFTLPIGKWLHSDSALRLIYRFNPDTQRFEIKNYMDAEVPTEDLEFVKTYHKSLPQGMNPMLCRYMHMCDVGTTPIDFIKGFAEYVAWEWSLQKIPKHPRATKLTLSAKIKSRSVSANAKEKSYVHTIQGEYFSVMEKRLKTNPWLLTDLVKSDVISRLQGKWDPMLVWNAEVTECSIADNKYKVVLVLKE